MSMMRIDKTELMGALDYIEHLMNEQKPHLQIMTGEEVLLRMRIAIIDLAQSAGETYKDILERQLKRNDKEGNAWDRRLKEIEKERDETNESRTGDGPSPEGEGSEDG
jgi:hypothetical protein